MSRLLPPDDLAPDRPTPFDRLLSLQLQERISQHFYTACDRITQVLLSQCRWMIVSDDALTLLILCTSVESYGQIMANLEQLGKYLRRFSESARIRVCPPAGKGKPYEVEVSDIHSS